MSVVRRRQGLARQARAFRVIDNRTSELTSWDTDLLPDALAGLDDLDIFSFDDVLPLAVTAGKTDPDDIPETPKNPVSSLLIDRANRRSHGASRGHLDTREAPPDVRGRHEARACRAPPGRRQARPDGDGPALAARGESRSYEGSTQSIRRTTLPRMAMGTRETDQPPLWIATSDLPTSPGHPFYARLTTLLDGHHFDRFVEGLCDRFYAPVMGRPSLAPGRYFRLLLVGSFEGIDSERGIAWRATDSLAVRSLQSRACRRHGDRRDCRGDTARCRCRRHHDDHRDRHRRGRAGRRRAGQR